MAANETKQDASKMSYTCINTREWTKKHFKTVELFISKQDEQGVDGDVSTTHNVWPCFDLDLVCKIYSITIINLCKSKYSVTRSWDSALTRFTDRQTQRRATQQDHVIAIKLKRLKNRLSRKEKKQAELATYGVDGAG